MTSNFVEIVSVSPRQGNCIPFAAIRWHDFGNRPALGRPFGHFSRHPDTPLVSLSPRRRFPRPTPERVFVAIHRSVAGFPETGSGARRLPHLERHIATITDNFGTDLDQLLPQRGQRPVVQFLRQRRRPRAGSGAALGFDETVEGDGEDDDDADDDLLDVGRHVHQHQAVDQHADQRRPDDGADATGSAAGSNRGPELAETDLREWLQSSSSLGDPGTVGNPLGDDHFSVLASAILPCEQHCESRQLPLKHLPCS